MYLFQPGETNNEVYQTLLRNINSYQAAFELINYDINIFRHERPEKEYIEVTTEILSETYRFLAKLCYK